MSIRNANFSHQRKIFDPRRGCKVVGFGAGAVGSWTALFLAKEGFTDIEWWDGDTVNSHNIPMALYGPEDIGKYKVECLRQIVQRLTGTSIHVHTKHYEGERLSNCIVVSCVDTMEEGRHRIWKEVKGKSSIPLYCDSRVAVAYVEVLSVRPFAPRDIARYETLLFDNKEAKRQMCGEHGIVYGSVNAARVIASNAAQAAMNSTVPWRFAERCDTLERAH